MLRGRALGGGGGMSRGAALHLGLGWPEAY